MHNDEIADIEELLERLDKSPKNKGTDVRGTGMVHKAINFPENWQVGETIKWRRSTSEWERQVIEQVGIFQKAD